MRKLGAGDLPIERGRYPAKQVSEILTCFSTSTYLDEGVADESVFRDRKIFWRWSLTDSTRCIVVRTVAGTEPAVELAFRLTLRSTERYAAEMGANTHQYQPLRLLRAGPVLFGVNKVIRLRCIRCIDLGFSPMTDKYRHTAPFDLDGLTDGDSEGELDGNLDGDPDGIADGLADGCVDGLALGAVCTMSAT